MLDLNSSDLIRLSLEGDAVHARVEQSLHSDLAIERAADNRRLARIGKGTDRLADWLDGAGLDVGDPVVLDTLTPGYAYGLRRPGERVIYEPPDAPDESLSRIAEDLE